MTQTRPEPKVIIIPAKEETLQDQKKKKNLRVAAYCRVSTKKDEQLNSYENQRDYYTEKIMANPNWTMADIFADEGITGTSACKRKDFLRMIRQCRKGKIDMILAKSVSRFARNTVDTLSYTRELRSMGIPVIFEEQNINSIYPESEFLITIHGAFAQSESEGISSRVKWGKHQAMRTGKANIQYRFFTMGGAKSHDIEDGILEPDAPDFERRLTMLQRKPRARYRINHISWWAQELPSDEEYTEARRNLDAVGWQVDYIITHCAPTSIALMETRHNEADRLTDFLQDVRERAKYHYWLFGHYHDNKAVDEKHILLWEQIVQIC